MKKRDDGHAEMTRKEWDTLLGESGNDHNRAWQVVVDRLYDEKHTLPDGTGLQIFFTD